jgi:ribosomal protein S18 acetylase RimI-like enzyme
MNAIPQSYAVRNARSAEFELIGKLMVTVYSQLEGFPNPTEQPDYYQMLAEVGALTNKPETELWVAVSADDQIVGAVVFFGDMKYAGAGGTAGMEKNASGFRLLAVDPLVRRRGIGNLLASACIRKSREKKLEQVIIHTTLAMKSAWKMYEQLGFTRSPDLDFMQKDLPVLGFRLIL